MFKLLTLDSNVFISDKEFSKRAGITGAEYNIYSADSLYLQTALDNSSVLVSLDEGIVLGVKDKRLPIEIYHPPKGVSIFVKDEMLFLWRRNEEGKSNLHDK